MKIERVIQLSYRRSEWMSEWGCFLPNMYSFATGLKVIGEAKNKGHKNNNEVRYVNIQLWAPHPRKSVFAAHLKPVICKRVHLMIVCRTSTNWTLLAQSPIIHLCLSLETQFISKSHQLTSKTKNFLSSRGSKGCLFRLLSSH